MAPSSTQEGGEMNLDKGLGTAQPSWNPVMVPSPTPSPSSTVASAPTLIIPTVRSIDRMSSSFTGSSITDHSATLSPSSTAMAPALILSNSGKRIDHAGKKKHVKQVTVHHNDEKLHLATQRGDPSIEKKIIVDINPQMTMKASEGDEKNTEKKRSEEPQKRENEEEQKIKEHKRERRN